MFLYHLYIYSVQSLNGEYRLGPNLNNTNLWYIFPGVGALYSPEWPPPNNDKFRKFLDSKIDSR